MTSKQRVQELLDEVLDSERTPEEVCASFPELLPEVRRRWRQMRHVQAELDAMFPTPAPGAASAPPVPWPSDNSLPSIPGYELEEVLGRGGMGVVYKARHLRLNRTVALKMLLAGAYAGPEERERFAREAEAVANLRHANIVQVYDVGDHEGRPYFTMEYLEGGSLAQSLAGQPQPARAAAEMTALLAQAVQVAHEGGIVHRDLKPANILLTAGGTPKIADFGLARHFEAASGLTLSGARVGTPSYMAPEQALGKARTVGPAADLYSLGALLYEMLTGRPPFRGETAAETELQVITQDPVTPWRLNPRVPPDLETICLKCLHKEPARRYATAAALADDLQRFQRGEPIAARPASLLERSGRLIRRHPTQFAVLAAGVLFALMLLGAGFWWLWHQARLRDAVEADLKALADFQERARWEEARTALALAQARLGNGGPADLQRKLADARRDFDLVTRLDAIRLSRVTGGELKFYKRQADQEYQTAFRKAGLGEVLDPPAPVAAAARTSAVREALMAALDDWALCTTDKNRRNWLLEVARQADADAAQGWSERIRDPAAWESRAVLSDLAQNVPADRSVSLLLALGERLKALGGDATPLLKRIQKEHPADFWANLVLGNALLPSEPWEASGYYRAALARRPDAAVGYCAVGDSLRQHKALAEACEYYHKALQLDPGYARGHSNLGLTLEAQNQLEQAIAQYREAVRLDPNYAWAHYNLASALQSEGMLAEAHEQGRLAMALEPNNFVIREGMIRIMVRQGKGLEELQAVWGRDLAAGATKAEAWAGYAELCLFLGKQAEYHRACHDLLEHFGTTTNGYLAEPVGRACLLLPGPADEMRKAGDLIDRAVAARKTTLDWVYPYALFARGLADYRHGDLAGATALLEGEAAQVMGPAPLLLLAMVQHDQGQTSQARRTLARAMVAFDWSAAQADSRDVWICHILRRQAEGKILPNLPAFLRGAYQPRDNDERLALLGVCQFQNRTHGASRLFADALAADTTLLARLTDEARRRKARSEKRPPGRIEQLTAHCCYPAARSAALAGCGLGADGANLSEPERQRWRKQAHAWLQHELGLRTEEIRQGSRNSRILAARILKQWQTDPDLAGLREPSALEKLPAEECQQVRRFWSEVATVLNSAQEG
jgi:serine/threonine-protein kinase